MNYGWVGIGGVGLALLATMLIGLELGLRWRFGFGKPLLYLADPQIGYLIAPNQQTRRFGNRIQINPYSMRSPAIDPTRPAQTWRILLLGDSVVNGGWWTDQTQTLTALLQTELQRLNTHPIEVLNASANSWSPRNELAYLRRFGSFESQTLILVINTDDLFGTAPYSVVVGRDPNYPNRQPPLALAEVLSRYVFKPSPIPELKAIQAESGDRVGFNLEAIRQIRDFAAQTDTQFMLLLTPLLRELGQPGPRDYERQARQRLQEFTVSQGIRYVDLLPIFNSLPDPRAIYHDHIHLNVQGNRQVVQVIQDKIESRF
ncbi:MAG: SGNH/GDSL hydrolase family protein [Elainella sp.]